MYEEYYFTGQRVPQGLHYRINLQSGFKEAKLLEEENEKTSVLAVESEKDDETSRQEIKTDVDFGEMEAARLRLEDALKNIPADKFEDETEERWKEISKKFKSYKEIKEDLKYLELNMKSEAELMKELVDKFLKITGNDESSRADKMTILEDIEYLSHSIDNSMIFISLGGLESIVVPNLNQTNVEILVKTLKVLGVLLQNNNEAKTYVIEKTNIDNYLINILSKSINSNQLSATLFAYGSLMRNNRKISAELFKKGLTVLIEIIVNEKAEVSLSLKTKALVLVDDLLSSDELKDQDHNKLIDSLKMCKHLANYFESNRNGLISDLDAMEKAIKAVVGLKHRCLHTWSEFPVFRRTLLVLLNNSKSQLETADEDLRFVYAENVLHLEELNNFLYSELKINSDDLSDKYNRINDELWGWRLTWFVCCFLLCWSLKRAMKGLIRWTPEKCGCIIDSLKPTMNQESFFLQLKDFKRKKIKAFFSQN